jgi:hypothetical protein
MSIFDPQLGVARVHGKHTYTHIHTHINTHTHVYKHDYKVLERLNSKRQNIDTHTISRS